MSDWRVAISVRYSTMEEWDEINEICRGIESDSGGGTGFGQRDLDYECETEEEAKTLSEKLKAAVEKAGFEVTYIDYYDQEAL